MNTSLPDVNVWIALAAEGHVDHVSARDWFASQPAASMAFCRVTHMGMLRLLTNPAVMGRAPRTIQQAWDIANQFRSDRRIVFASEPEGLEPVWRKLMTQRGIGPSSWTDAYLAAFAQAQPHSLVTFDMGFRRWADLELTVLSH